MTNPETLSDLHQRYDGPIPDHLRDAAMARYPERLKGEPDIVSRATDSARAHGVELGKLEALRRVRGLVGVISNGELLAYIDRLTLRAHDDAGERAAYATRCRQELVDGMVRDGR